MKARAIGKDRACLETCQVDTHILQDYQSGIEAGTAYLSQKD